MNAKDRDILVTVIRALLILVLVIPTIFSFIIPKIIKPLRLRVSFWNEYGTFGKSKPEDGTYTDKDGEVSFKISYNYDESSWGDGYADYYYSKDYISFVRNVSDKYYDDALIIDNFFLSQPHFYWHNIVNVDTFEEYCKVGIRHIMWVYLSEDDDVSKVDDMLSDIADSVTYENLAVVVMKVPDDIYEANKDISCYTSYDGLEEQFVEELGTADFRTITSNEYIVGSYNLSYHSWNNGKLTYDYDYENDYTPVGYYRGYVTDIVEEETEYGAINHYLHVGSDLGDDSEYISFFVNDEEEYQIGDEVVFRAGVICDYDENNIVTGFYLPNKEISKGYSEIGANEKDIKPVEELFNMKGQPLEQPVYRATGKLFLVCGDYRLYSDFDHDTGSYITLLFADEDDEEKYMSLLNKDVCVEGIFKENEMDCFLYSARIVQE